MKVYVILYEYGLDAIIEDVYADALEAIKKCKKLNSDRIKNGTYSVIEKELK